MLIVCFEDSQVARLSVAVLARPAYAVTCGSYRLIDWLQVIASEHGGTLHGKVRSHLRALQTHDFGIEAAEEIQGEQSVMLVNARLAPTVSNLKRLKTLAKSSAATAILDSGDEAVLAARIHVPAGEPTTLAALLKSAAESTVSNAIDDDQWDVYRWPHDLVRFQMTSMADAMEYRIASGDYQQLQDGVFVSEGTKVGQYVVFDPSDGPIVLDRDVQVGPFCYFAGPVYAGPKTRIIEHASLKDAVSLGHTVKIGGEVEASVIEPYTNKQHHGFLGHSYLGSWINLGAGTCNSDLKNTYGKINAEYKGAKVPTDMQFFGCVMGDYSKTAINTSIFTGKVIGVCSMMYGFVTSNVPSYVNYARLFGQTSLLPAEVMISTQARMFARRKVEQRPCDEQLIRDMYSLSADERSTDAELL